MEKSKKVYIIECESGCWDDHHTWIGGVFTDKKQAEEHASFLNKTMEEIKSIPFPFEGDPDDFNSNGLSEENKEKYYKWWSMNSYASEWGKAIVKDFELNTPLGGHWSYRYIEDVLNEKMNSIKKVKEHNCRYSKSMHQPYPRLCIDCGKPEEVELKNEDL